MHIKQIVQYGRKHLYNQSDRKFNNQMFPLKDILSFICRKKE